LERVAHFPEDELEARLVRGEVTRSLDELQYLVLVCPIHHAAIHRDDALFDDGGPSFRGSRRG
jgi:hypothetical protein